MNIVDVRRSDSSNGQIITLSDMAAPISVRFSVTAVTTSGKVVEENGVVNATMLPQPLLQYRADSHYTAAGDATLIQVQPAQHETGVGLSYVNGIPVGTPISSALSNLYSQGNFTTFPYAANQDATGQVSTAIVPLDAEAMMAMTPAPTGTDYYQGDHTELVITLPSSEKNYILLPSASRSAFDVVNYDGFDTTKVYDGESVTIESNDARFPERSSALDEHSLTFLNSNTTSANVGAYEMLFKMLAEGSTAGSSAVGAKTVNVEITQRPIVISGLDLNVSVPAINDYTVEQLGQDRGLLAGHTVVGVDLNVAGLTYLPANATILDASGNDVTANYAISYEPGTLVVTTPDGGTTPDDGTTPDGGTTTTTPATTTPATATPVAPVTPAEPAAMDIPEADAPLAAAPGADETVEIEETDVPLAGFGGAWSLLDLILTVVTGLMSVCLLITYFKNKKKDEEEEDEKTKAKAMKSENEEDESRLKRKGMYRVFSIVPMLGAITLFLAWFLIGNMYHVISRRIFLESRVYKKVSLQKILFYIKEWGHVSKVMFVKSFYHILWSLVFGVGGIIKHYSYFLVPYILSENPTLSAREAITQSRKMMNGNKWKCFRIDLSFLGWDILVVATLGLSGLFYSNAYKVTAYTD